MLSRGLNALFLDEEYRGYGMLKWCPNINLLAYADDTILFCLGDRKSMKKMIMVLRRYEQTSSQLVNKTKSYFYLHDNTSLIVAI